MASVANLSIVPVARMATLLMLSGGCALAYQIAWFRQFALVFGSTTAASAAVTAIFLGGLGLGNLVLGRLADRHRKPLRLYAELEASVALLALASPLMLGVAQQLYLSTGGQHTLGIEGATLLRLLLAILVLGLPTFLMGGTLPAAVAAATRTDDAHRRSAAKLYGANTLGAVLGIMLATFVALPSLGVRWSLGSAAALNLLVALAAALLARRLPPRARATDAWQVGERAAAESIATRTLESGQGSSTSQTSQASPQPLVSQSRAERVKAARRQTHLRAEQQRAQASEAVGTAEPVLPGVVLVVAALVGFAFMLMELVWFRMLAPLLGGTTFTFSIILAVALTGIGAGGLIYAWLFRQRVPTLGALATSCAAEAAALGIPLALGDRLAMWAADLQTHATESFASDVWHWTLIASLVVLPASLVSGVQFPLLLGLLGRAEQAVGQQLGRVYASNVCGNIAGALAGGFGLIGLLSAVGAWRLAIALLLVTSLGLLLLMTRRPQTRRPWLALAAGTLAVWTLATVGPTAVWRHSGIGAGRALVPAASDTNARLDWQATQRRRTLWEADGHEAAVAIIADGGYSFMVNGKSDGHAISDAGTQIMLGLLGALIHDAPRECLVVGLGTGETAGWLAEVPRVERVDVLEIEPAVEEMARRCAEVNFDALQHPKVRLLRGDAREYLLTLPGNYDLIVSEPSNPYRAGVANLFTQELYLAVQNKLRPEGIFVQWLQGYEIDERTAHTVVATLRSVFPYVELWQSKRSDLLLVCSMQPLRIDAPRWRERLASHPWRSGIANGWQTDSLEGVLAHYVANSALADHLAQTIGPAINTDDHNRIELGFARMLGRSESFDVEMLAELASSLSAASLPLPPGDYDAARLSNESLAMHSWLYRSVDPSELDDPVLGRQAAALQAYFDDNYAEMVAQWQAIGRLPTTRIETALLAASLANEGAELSEELLIQLHGFSPTEALLVKAISLAKREANEAAAVALQAAFVALRTDPWTMYDLTVLALSASLELARDKPVLAATMLNGVREPWQVGYADELRRTTALILATYVGPEETLRWVESFEPHVPWNERFLQLRLRTYDAMNHPLTGRAAVELSDFLEHAGGQPTASP